MDDLIDTMKRLVLEAEDLIECVEEDADCDIRWEGEKETLLKTMEEARTFLWPE